MSSLTSERKRERMYANQGTILSDRVYNFVLGFTTLYGLIVNVVLCLVLGDSMSSVNPYLIFGGYFVSCFIGIAMSSASPNPFISFIGYNLVVIPVGLVLSILISDYDAEGMSPIVYQAIAITGAITFIMLALATAFPNFFKNLGGVLFVALLGLLIIGGIVTIFFSWGLSFYSWISAGIFSLYIGYDFWKAQQYPKTLDNAVDSALDIYLDIINLFLAILRILSGSKSKKS